MSNSYFRKDDLKQRKGWQAHMAQALTEQKLCPGYSCLPDSLSPQVVVIRPGPFRAPDARLVLTRDQDGLAVGFTCHRGYKEAGRVEWQLGPDWDWQKLMALVNEPSAFQETFGRVKAELPDAAFWITSGEGDPETFNVYATGLPLEALRGLLNAWPGNLWCELGFGVHLEQTSLIKATDAEVLARLGVILRKLEPLLRPFSVPPETPGAETPTLADAAPQA